MLVLYNNRVILLLILGTRCISGIPISDEDQVSSRLEAIDVQDNTEAERKEVLVKKVLDLISKKSLVLLEKSDRLNENSNEVVDITEEKVVSDLAADVADLINEATLDEIEEAVAVSFV